MSGPAITPERFDRLLVAPERLWGAKSIAAVLGVSEGTVRRWARDPDVPVYSPRRGRYFARRSELETWLRSKPAS